MPSVILPKKKKKKEKKKEEMLHQSDTCFHQIVFETCFKPIFRGKLDHDLIQGRLETSGECL